MNVPQKASLDIQASELRLSSRVTILGTAIRYIYSLYICLNAFCMSCRDCKYDLDVHILHKVKIECIYRIRENTSLVNEVLLCS